MTSSFPPFPEETYKLLSQIQGNHSMCAYKRKFNGWWACILCQFKCPIKVISVIYIEFNEEKSYEIQAFSDVNGESPVYYRDEDKYPQSCSNEQELIEELKYLLRWNEKNIK